MANTLGYGGNADGSSTLGYGTHLTDIASLVDRAQTRAANAQALGQVFETPEAKAHGAGALGFLSGALDLLGRPGSAVVGGIEHFGGADGTDSAQAVWDALAHGKKYSLANTGPFQTLPGDALPVRTLKGAGAFLGNTAADPLTYGTFGGGGLARKTIAGLWATTGEKAAAEHLGKDGLEQLARGTERFRAADNAATAVRDRALAAPNADPESAGALYEQTLRGNLGDTLEAIGGRHFGDVLGETYLKHGPAGVKSKLVELLGPEKGEQVWKGVRANLRGGIQFRANPFGSDTHSITGGGHFAAFDTSKARSLNFLREKAGSAAALFGNDAKQYTSVLKGLRTGDADAMRFGEWRAGHETNTLERHAGDQLKARSAAVAGAAINALDDAISGGMSQADAEAAFKELFHNREKAAQVAAGGSDDPHLVALAAAAERMHTHLDSLGITAQDEGLGLDLLNDYIPRQMTEDYKALKRADMAPLNSGRAGDASPLKHRYAFYDEVLNPVTGKLETKFRDIPTINAQMADLFGDTAGKVFEDDPLKIFAAYTGVMDRKIANRQLENEMVRLGLAVRTGTETGKGAFDAAGLGHHLNTTADRLARDADLFRGGDHYDQLDEMADEEAHLAGLMAHLEGDAHDAPAKAGDIIAGIAELEGRRAERLAAAGLDKRAAVAGRDAQEAAARKPGDYFASDTEGDAAAQAYGQHGYVRLGSDDRNEDAVVKNWVGGDETANLLSRRAVRMIGRRHWQMDDAGQLEQWMNDYYAPLYALSKSGMTIGGGPGFHARNGMGGMQNAYSLGANAGDFVGGGSVIKTAQAALRKAAKAGLVGADADAAVRAAVIAKHGNQILPNGMSLAQAYDAAVRHGIFHPAQLMDQTTAGVGDVTQNLRRMTKDARQAGWLAPTRDYNPRLADPTEEASGLARGVRKTANTIGNNPLWRASAKMGEVVEQYNRFGSFLAGLRQYGDPRAAAALVKASQFSYDPRDLSPFERKVVKQLLPFWVWMKNNTPLQARVLMSNPGRIAMIQRAQTDLLASMFRDPEADADFEDHKPDWIRRKLGFDTRLKFGGRNIVLNLESPINDPNTMFNWDPRHPLNTRQLISGLNPVIKTPLEGAIGVNTDTGAEFNPNGSRAANWMQVIPGLTHRDTNGTLRTGDYGQRVLDQGLTAVGLGKVDNLFPWLGAEDQKPRALGNWMSFLGAPVATDTELQRMGEDLARSDRLNQSSGEAADAAGVDQSLVSDLLAKGYTPDMIRDLLPVLAEKTTLMRQNAQLMEQTNLDEAARRREYLQQLWNS